MNTTSVASKLYIKIDGVKSFSFKEMALATNDFDSSTQVGEGGYGTVYKGNLADKTVVAIKRAKEGSLQGQKEFLTEIELLSRLHHRNLVSLVGYCDEEGEQVCWVEMAPENFSNSNSSNNSYVILSLLRRVLLFVFCYSTIPVFCT